MVSLRFLVLALAMVLGCQGVAGHELGGHGLEGVGVEGVRRHEGNVEDGGFHAMEHRSTNLKYGMPPAHPRDTIFANKAVVAKDQAVPRDTCEVICKPNFCVGPVTLEGTTTQLTYLCPATATPTDRATVFVTVTEEVTVTPTITVSATNGVVSPAPSDEVTSTVTITTANLFSKTVTVYLPSLSHVTFGEPISTIQPSMEEPSKTEEPKSSNVSTTTDEPTTTVTEHRISTVLLTITLSSHHSTSRLPSQVPPFPFPNSTTLNGVSSTSAFPSLVLSSSANGTIIDGVSYTGSPGLSGSASSYTATGTGTGYALPIRRRDQADMSVHSVITVTYTITQDGRTSTVTQTRGGPGDSYPGAVTQKLGTGLAGRASVSIMALVLALAAAIILL
ncbi:hypothetical protein BDV96DRAFT_290073 [Lophiotrema nucula]|uniref:Uncharacterized protein n=1 Tax=Lophiotrema nucula TaxID=690887 RepID=A0A6A5YLE4_9PLEO|nr:hypothetical protein BDV96DRAFT_290073 [Lophiotrema nucula]